MLGLFLAAVHFAIGVFAVHRPVAVAAVATLEFLWWFCPVVMATMVCVGQIASYQERRATRMFARLVWENYKIGARVDAVGYLLLFAATTALIGRFGNDPTWKLAIMGSIAALLTWCAWRCFRAAASFLYDALLK